MAIRIEGQAEPIPGYKLLDRLGGGGFGEVWRAEAPGGLLKAIKIVYGDLQASDEEGTRRAEQELKALDRVKTVRHPYLLSLERYDIVDGRLMIVMELADRNLWDRFRECRSQGLSGIPRDELLRYLEEAAEVLDLMDREHKLQHLDIKPQNLFLVHSHVKVADFGLVKALEGKTATVTGGVTPVYAAPETFDGVVSRFCDQYSLAIVYQELLTGQRPFAGSSVQQLIMQHLTATPNVAPLPPGDRDAISRSLAKKPEERFPSCGEMVRALRTGDGGAGPGARVAVRRAEPDAPARAEAESIPQPAAGDVSFVRPSGVMLRPRPAEEPPPLASTPPPRPAPPEVTGDGVLFPALVIGLGEVGLEVLQRLRETVQERFGSAQALPNLRLLGIDTDPETAQASYGGERSALTPGEILLARLNRPIHYLKPRDGRVPIDTWFDPQMLYRIPRNPVTTGLRALGRLAFFDNYRQIAGRLRAELEACTDPEALATAEQQTKLGMRTNRPRVYLLSSLSGGTGGGMFIDLAYALRQVLRQLGYARPEVLGLFFLPCADRNLTPAGTQALGNAFAALTELNHFSVPDTTFLARYDEKEGLISDREPPFARAILLPLAEEGRTPSSRASVGLAGEFLCRELTSPLGRAADATRAAFAASLGLGARLSCQSVGLSRFSWPRRALLQRAARVLCERLVQRWISKDSVPLREAVQDWVTEQWAKYDLGPEHLIDRLQKACERAVGQPPEALFNSLTQPLIPKGRRAPEPNPVAVMDAVEKLEQLVGLPDETAVTRRGCTVADALGPATDAALKDWSHRIAQFAVTLIEQPEFRLAGAEEAIRQLTATIERVLEHHEPLCQELGEQAANAYGRIHSTLNTLQANPGGGRRMAPVIQELGEALQLYPKWRHQGLVLQHVNKTYVSLRGQLSDQLREVGFCRHRLGELIRAFEDPSGVSRSSSARGPCTFLLPAGCQSLGEAVKRVLETVTLDDLKKLDQQVQVMIRQQFTALVHVCLTSSNLLRNLEAAMQEQGEAFVSARLAGANIVEMFLAQYPNDMEAAERLASAFDEAAPPLGGGGPVAVREIQIVALPAGPQKQRFAQLVHKAVPESEFAVTDSPDDILFYREQPHVSLAGLEQLGPQAYDAYCQMISRDRFTPHSRIDIAEWLAIREQ